MRILQIGEKYYVWAAASRWAVCSFVLYISLHTRTHSDLYWIDCSIPLERFLELRHHQVHTTFNH